MTNFLITKLSPLLQESSLQAKHQDPTDWDNVLTSCRYVPVGYTPAMIAYQQSYLAEYCEYVQNISVTLWHERRPIGVWPLNLSQKNGRWHLGSNEGGVMPPLFRADVSPRTVKSIYQRCFKLLNIFKDSEFKISAWDGIQCLTPDQCPNIWHHLQMSGGASLTAQHDLYVDLSLPLDSIKASFRESYRSLVNSGSKLWSVNLLDSADEEVWDEFRKLHIHVAGRETRPLSTWRLQLDAISQQAAFLIYLRDASGCMVGGGLFHISSHECLYAVGAYERSLFDKPLGHVVQYHAIQHMQRLGLRWYKIGARPYPADMPRPTAKELSIADFKEGFATHYSLRLHTNKLAI